MCYLLSASCMKSRSLVVVGGWGSNLLRCIQLVVVVVVVSLTLGKIFACFLFFFVNRLECIFYDCFDATLPCHNYFWIEHEFEVIDLIFSCYCWWWWWFRVTISNCITLCVLISALVCTSFSSSSFSSSSATFKHN